MRHSLSLLLPSAALAATLFAAAPASAQSAALESGSSTWRRGSRPADASLSRFTFELRFGAYYPEVDEEFAGGATPFADYFGTGAQFYFGAELDWTPIRIPYVGRLGPGFGWGFTTMSGAARLTSGATDTEESAGPKTSLTIHAMHASAVLRVDEISRRTIVPLVPYAKLGFGFGTWSSGTDTGTSKIGTDCNAATPTDCVVAEGLSIGPHIALGGMLGLNWLDPRSGAMARENTGINQAYVFGEWMWSNLDSGIDKPAMHIGTSTWVLGLAVDM
ncbi:MAG: MXAN_2562 family outer membrane beta-barrel protein [Polyangiaceae bacterium]